MRHVPWTLLHVTLIETGGGSRTVANEYFRAQAEGLNRRPELGRRIHEGMARGAVGPGTLEGQAKRTPAIEPAQRTVTHANSTAMRTMNHKQRRHNWSNR